MIINANVLTDQVRMEFPGLGAHSIPAEFCWAMTKLFTHAALRDLHVKIYHEPVFDSQGRLFGHIWVCEAGGVSAGGDSPFLAMKKWWNDFGDK